MSVPPVRVTLRTVWGPRTCSEVRHWWMMRAGCLWGSQPYVLFHKLQLQGSIPLPINKVWLARFKIVSQTCSRPDFQFLENVFLNLLGKGRIGTSGRSLFNYISCMVSLWGMSCVFVYQVSVCSNQSYFAFHLIRNALQSHLGFSFDFFFFF